MFSKMFGGRARATPGAVLEALAARPPHPWGASIARRAYRLRWEGASVAARGGNGGGARTKFWPQGLDEQLMRPRPPKPRFRRAAVAALRTATAHRGVRGHVAPLSRRLVRKGRDGALCWAKQAL